MRKYINKNNLFITIFILLQIINFCFIHIPGMNFLEGRYHEYLTTVVSFLACFMFFKKPSLYHLAFFFILIADLFLVVIKPQAIEAGLISFILVAFTFAAIIYKGQRQKTKLPILIVRFALTILTALVVGIVSKSNVILILTSIYGVNLICNIIASFFKEKFDWLLAIGLILFLLCDISVGLHAGIDLGMFPENGNLFYNYIAAVSINTGWIYYVLCLTCLSLCTVKNNKENAPLFEINQ